MADRPYNDDDWFHLGVMAALDVVYSMDGDPTATLAVEIMKTIDRKKLLAIARFERHFNLKKFVATAREVSRG